MIGPAVVALLLAAPPASSDLVVVPPDTTGVEPRFAWLGEVVGALLPRSLAIAGMPAVERADRLRAQAALEIPLVPLTRATSIRVAEALGTSHLVVGACALTDGRLRVSLRLLDAARGTLSAPFVASGPIARVPELVHELAWELALSEPPAPSLSREAYLEQAPHVGPEALEAFGAALAARESGARRNLLKRALQRDPGFAEARLSLGRLQLEARDFAAAYETLAALGESTPQARSAGFLEAVAMLELGRYSEAAGLLATLTAAQPTASALNNRALALLRSPTPEARASDVLRRALELDPGALDTRFNLGFALLYEGDARAAVPELEAVVSEDPLDGHARVVLSWALRAAGRTEQADESWKGVLALAPSYDALANPDLSRRFERILPSERRLHARSARSVSEVAASLVGRAERLAQAEKPEAALRELNRAAYLDPYVPRLHVLLARVHRQRGDRQSALNELRMALWTQDDADVRAELAVLLNELGRRDEARVEAKRALDLDPENVTARRALGGP